MAMLCIVINAVVLVQPCASCSKTIEASSLPNPIPPSLLSTYRERKPSSPAFTKVSLGKKVSLSHSAAKGLSSFSENVFARSL